MRYCLRSIGLANRFLRARSSPRLQASLLRLLLAVILRLEN